MRTHHLLALLLGLTSAPSTHADHDAGGAAESREKAAILQKVAPSLVRVEYTLRYDGGHEPKTRDWGTRCASCGQFHTERIDRLVRDERPIERAGFLVAPDRVVTSHLLVNPRFIERISVRHGDQTVDATLRAYAIEQKGVTLGLAMPLKSATPLSFEPDSPTGSLFAVTYQQAGGRWHSGISEFSERLLMRDDGAVRLQSPSEAVIVDERGRAAGIALREDLPADGSWKMAPAKWPSVSADAIRTHAASLSGAQSMLARVSLHFRSPREEAGRHGMRGRMPGPGGEERSATEINAAALLLDDGIVVILAAIPPSETVRLENIRVYRESGPIPADFVGSLTDYGALVARLKDPLPVGGHLSTQANEDLRASLLLGVEAEIAGDQLQRHVEPLRMADLSPGRQRMLIPELAGDGENVFLFDLEGKLLAAPVEVRERALGEERRWRSTDTILLPASALAAILGDLPAHIDPANVPQSEADEQRLAWIGLDLQPLDASLARVHGISNQTNNGESGAVVTFVYPGSPAATAGIEPGDILLRIRLHDHPRPYPVQLTDERSWNEPFPWDQLDQIPEQYYHMLPQPWTSVANSFNRFLTDLGTGRSFMLETAREGRLQNHLLEVVRGPDHYDSAPEFKSEGIGLTVRELTFETRRFFQREQDSPGLVVARIEPGSSASTGGLKPFELITHVNDQPVRTIDEFSEAAKAGGDIRLAVQRMHQGRIAIVRAGR